ncbi:hypothetical protein [Raoultibacter timonensis]|uniref:hypothetical protein n=1 Tax=Raoultibacter timonensis TaxID=1907662 RepID=UPI0026DD088E|nr:hypothetical protein [Raoultibacter timonensis]
MTETKKASILLALAYGASDAVNRDVDAFEVFYAKNFKDEALAKLETRERSRYRIFAIAFIVGALLLTLPMFVNPSSIFAVILLSMGCLLLAAGLFSIYRMATVRQRCIRNFDKLMGDEFAATRSVTKRVFEVRFTDSDVTVNFGAQTAIKQTRTKCYEEIAGVYATDELVFVKGLTWMARFQMEDEGFRRVCALLEEKCLDRYHDWTGRAI